MRSFWGTGLAAGLLWAACQSASAYVEISGVFIADDRCQALESIRRETNPGNVLTIPGQSYNVRALNREDGDYVQLDVPNAIPRIRWVSVTCGDLFSEAEDTRPLERLGGADGHAKSRTVALSGGVRKNGRAAQAILGPIWART